jgi:A/G-specific adenine glycosylase
LIADGLLAWYDRHARKLPWRVGPKERARGVTPDPYRVWLSEIMLQQTGVTTVKPYFEDFIRRWPTVEALAAASRDDVLKAWAGLGYYARARNLKACAEIVAARHGGVFPTTFEGLRALPGIGEYTAAAIVVIAFDVPATVVDANIERVIARLFAIDMPLPAAKRAIREEQGRLTPMLRAGDYVQAMMDLGAAICTPKRPACSLCPIAESCIARVRGEQETYPVRAGKAERPTRHGVAFVAVRPDGAVLLRQRGDAGLLGGMSEVPGTEWTSRAAAATAEDAPLRVEWTRVTGTVIHVFTHFRLKLTIWRGAAAMNTKAPAGTWWALPDDLPGEALPTVMKKAIEAALPGATKRRRAA